MGYSVREAFYARVVIVVVVYSLEAKDLNTEKKVLLYQSHLLK